MAEIARRLKIHKLLASQPCMHCGDELLLGEAGAVCEACESPHHERCWDQMNGCSQEGCQNAYLPNIVPAELVINLKSDEKVCHYCKKKIYLHADKCRHCGLILIDDGEYYGEKKIAPAASRSLLLGVVGLLSCITPLTSLIALILGPLAVKDATAARKLIATDPTKQGEGMATAGRILGTLGIVICLAAIMGFPWGYAYPNVYQLVIQADFYSIPFIGVVLIVAFFRRQ
ncbi:MAG TPA: RING finger protein [Pyrinomonadaceae bacterium]|nr:RING finger protein [Pyrinomonadaceae bacterium]